MNDAEPAKEPPAEVKLDYSDSAFLFKYFNEQLDEKGFKDGFPKHIEALAKKYGVSDDYEILFLLDEDDELSSWHSNRLYRGASVAAGKKDVLLLISSRGGRIEPAYLISKTCKRLSKEKFAVSVPRKAKSAATLIALGADEIHMGLISELGPIDPQFGDFPALGMKNALNLLADVCCKYPGSSAMLGEYLSKKLDLNVLGYFERISESAAQYAERLLTGKRLPKGVDAKKLADHFVNHYKDHGFVIDADEAKGLLGEPIVKTKTKEYDFGNAVYESIDFMRFVLSRYGKDLDYVGDLAGGLNLRQKKGR